MSKKTKSVQDTVQGQGAPRRNSHVYDREPIEQTRERLRRLLRNQQDKDGPWYLPGLSSALADLSTTPSSNTGCDCITKDATSAKSNTASNSKNSSTHSSYTSLSSSNDSTSYKMDVLDENLEETAYDRMMKRRQIIKQVRGEFSVTYS